MKSALIAAVVVGSILGGGAHSAFATPFTFSDDFNDGNTDGWWLGPSQANQSVNGNWRVDGGHLAQDAAGDGFMALVLGLEASSQSIATDVWTNGPSGYGGVLFWYQDVNHWATVILYPAVHSVFVFNFAKNADGSDDSNSVRYMFDINDAAVHRLAVDLEGSTGQATVSLDGSFLLTQQMAGTIRTGQSGLFNGNAGGYFDNFTLTSADGNLAPVPEPPALLLLGTLLLALGVRKRLKQRLQIT